MSPPPSLRILVTGTPGTGKSSLAEELGAALKIPVVEVGDLIKENKLYEEWDDEMDCSIFDEDKVVAEVRKAQFIISSKTLKCNAFIS